MARYPALAHVLIMVRPFSSISTHIVISGVLILAQTVRAPASLVAETGSAGSLDGHPRGIHLQHIPDHQSYRGILMTIRSLASGFLTYAFGDLVVPPNQFSPPCDVNLYPVMPTDTLGRPGNSGSFVLLSVPASCH